MYNITDTIAAISSAGNEKRVILRLAGDEVFEVLDDIVIPAVPRKTSTITAGKISLAGGFSVDVSVQVFIAPNSYTGQTTAELFLDTNKSVTEAVIKKILKKNCRIAHPGEFTARAYMNGKLDLAQAEAVNEIICSSNRLQLAAAEKILSGELSKMTEELNEDITCCLSLLEAGIDFSDQDIEQADVTENFSCISSRLKDILENSTNFESVIDLASVGIAGLANAGKSSLSNKLLGRKRSIVSRLSGTTRDVLSGRMKLGHGEIILFDCAGLALGTYSILDELARSAAIEALTGSTAVLFLVDISKDNFTEDIEALKLISCENIIYAASKIDLLSQDKAKMKMQELEELFGCDFIPVSSKKSTGIDELKQSIDKIISSGTSSRTDTSKIALSARHKDSIEQAIRDVQDAARKFETNDIEISAMFLRAAHTVLCGITHSSVNEKILDKIFSNFCIGK